MNKKGQLAAIDLILSLVVSFILVGAFGQVLVPIQVNLIAPAIGNLPNSGTNNSIVGIGYILFFAIPIFAGIAGLRSISRGDQQI